MARLEGIWNTNTDWKKILKNIIGRSLSPEDKRSAFANKNRLAAFGQITRADKDKYDSMDCIFCFIDSSGSMSDHMLQLVLSEVYTLANQKKPVTLVVVQCDTRITDVKIYRDLRQLKRDMVHAEVKGRGGTELKPCWDLLSDKGAQAKWGLPKQMNVELVLCFTDGWLDQYPRDRRTMQNLVWVTIDNPGFEVKYSDSRTKWVNLDSSSIK